TRKNDFDKAFLQFKSKQGRDEIADVRLSNLIIERDLEKGVRISPVFIPVVFNFLAAHLNTLPEFTGEKAVKPEELCTLDFSREDLTGIRAAAKQWAAIQKMTLGNHMGVSHDNETKALIIVPVEFGKNTDRHFNGPYEAAIFHLFGLRRAGHTISIRNTNWSESVKINPLSSEAVMAEYYRDIAASGGGITLMTGTLPEGMAKALGVKVFKRTAEGLAKYIRAFTPEAIVADTYLISHRSKTVIANTEDVFKGGAKLNDNHFKGIGDSILAIIDELSIRTSELDEHIAIFPSNKTTDHTKMLADVQERLTRMNKERLAKAGYVDIIYQNTDDGRWYKLEWNTEEQCYNAPEVMGKYEKQVEDYLVKPGINQTVLLAGPGSIFGFDPHINSVAKGAKKTHVFHVFDTTSTLEEFIQNLGRVRGLIYDFIAGKARETGKEKEFNDRTIFVIGKPEGINFYQALQIFIDNQVRDEQANNLRTVEEAIRLFGETALRAIQKRLPKKAAEKGVGRVGYSEQAAFSIRSG
ncbi:MAG: hypothetical protein AAB267_01760, partial [Candidatus Desantisbacteria bacterium]